MADEQQYLQNNLKAVISRATDKSATGQAFRLGSVFYEERAGKLITHSLALTTDLAKAFLHIKEQTTSSSHSPTAMDIALEEAIFRQPWAREATSRLLFFMLDSQPEYTPALAEKLFRVSHEAARKGIKIIPVVTGNVNKETEFVLRSLAMRTNGSYIFTTNNHTDGKLQHPGNWHLTEGDLKDLLLRQIQQHNEVK
jgi:hypothetical protein